MSLLKKILKKIAFIYLGLFIVSLSLLTIFELYDFFKDSKTATSTRSLSSTSARYSNFIKKVERSKLGSHYLALSGEDIKKHNEETAQIVTLRAGQICKKNGYQSALNFDFVVHKKDKYLTFFNETGEEVKHQFKPLMKWGSVTFDAGMFVITGGLAAVASYLGRRSILALGSLLSIEYGISYGLHTISASKLDEIKLEGMYKIYFLSFTDLRCLDYPEATEDEIFEFEVRYACQLSENERDFCKEEDINTIQCFLNLDSLDENIMKPFATCQNLIEKLPSKGASECFLKALGVQPSTSKKVLDDYVKNCSNLPKDPEQVSCVMKSIEKTGENIFLYRVLDDYIEECSKLPKDPEQVSCVMQSIEKNNSSYSYKVLESYVKTCSKLPKDPNQVSCVMKSIEKTDENVFFHQKRLSEYVEWCSRLSKDPDQVSCVMKSIEKTNRTYLYKVLEGYVKTCSSLPKDPEQVSCVMEFIEKTEKNVYLDKVLDEYINTCSNLPKDPNKVSCVMKSIEKHHKNFHLHAILNDYVEECSKLPKDPDQVSCIMRSIEKTKKNIFLHRVLDTYVEECSNLPKDPDQVSCVMKSIEKPNRADLYEALDDYIEECSKLPKDPDQVSCVMKFIEKTKKNVYLNKVLDEYIKTCSLPKEQISCVTKSIEETRKNLFLHHVLDDYVEECSSSSK